MTIRKAEVPQVWRFEEAKARLSQLVDEAMNGQPQQITRRGKKAVFVVDAEQWEALNGQGRSGLELFRHAPKLNEQEFVEWERQLDRTQTVFQERELDLD